MSKWKTVKIKDVCEKASSNIAQKDIRDNDGEYPIYGASGFIKTVDFYVQDKEYIGIVKDGAGVGRVMLLPPKSSVIGTIQYIVPNERVNAKYLANILTKLDLGKLYSGATIPHIYFKNYENIEIPLPPLEEQKRIADILDKASNLIDLRKQQLEKMNLLIKSKFIDMFGDPVTNPKGWQVQRIEELCEAIFGGGTPSKSHAEYYDGDIPWVTSKDMKSILISDSIDHINDKAVLNSSAKYIPKQSLLMVIRSGILKHTLPLGINTRVVTINQDMKAFIPNANINVWFMFYTFKMHEKSLLNNVRAVTADNIEFSIIRNLMVPVPSLELQNQFAEFVEQVEKQKVVMQQSLEKMEMNYKALMQEYF